MKNLLFALTFATLVAGSAFAGTANGSISNDNDWDVINLYANSTDIDVTFTFPQGQDFMVTVFGRSHNVLGEFHLLEGETINLTGGGQFYLLVHSLSGRGPWSAAW